MIITLLLQNKSHFLRLVIISFRSIASSQHLCFDIYYRVKNFVKITDIFDVILHISEIEEPITGIIRERSPDAF